MSSGNTFLLLSSFTGGTFVVCFVTQYGSHNPIWDDSTCFVIIRAYGILKMQYMHALVLLLVVASASAFMSGLSRNKNSLKMAADFDVDKVVRTLSRNKILTKTAQLGLLTKLEKAGFTLTSAKPLLKLADKYDLIGVLVASNEKVLPLIAKGVELAPSLLPLAKVAVNTQPTALYSFALASLAAAGAAIAVIPDVTVTDYALQTVLAVPLGVVVPGACVVGATLLGKLNK